MDTMRKNRMRRGMTLVEVLVVVALLTIMIGLAVPNIISAQRHLKLKELNENARAVAVAVQSKLYGMRNAGTSSTSAYTILNETAAFTTEIVPTSKTGEEKEAENVCYVCNFIWADEELGDGETSEKEPISEEEKKDKVKKGSSMLLTGALMDLELQKGKIAVFFKPETADVLEVFYSEKEFDIPVIIQLLEMSYLTQDYLDEREIGHYYGYGVEEPERLEGMPLFTCSWVWDDELRLQIKMLTQPSEELMKKKLGLEIYLQFPSLDESAGKKEEMMIYAEGIFASDYTATDYIQQDVLLPEGKRDVKTIKRDDPLTFEKIKANNNVLNFALDSMVTAKAGWGSMKHYLRHESEPDVTSTAESLLYPRDSISFWTDCTQNPYLTVWFRQHADKTSGRYDNSDPDMSQKLYDTVAKYVEEGASRTPTNFVGVDKRISLRVKLYVLAEDDAGNLETCDPDLEHPTSCVDKLRKADESIGAVNIVSHSIDPYYYLLTSSGKEVALTSMRDFSNLRYIFQSKNNIEVARLHSDISGQQFFTKLTNVREELKTKLGKLVGRTGEVKTVTDNWPDGASRDGCAVDAMYINNKNMDDSCLKGFTLSGKKSDTENYKISNIAAGTENWDLGGYFGLAQNCTFQDLDFVNSESWRNGYTRSLIKKEDSSGKITGFDVNATGGVTGTLVGIAVNCKFDNVRVYIDPQDQLKDSSGNTATNISYDRLSGVLVGGLVGLAIGDNGEKIGDENSGETTITNCVASIITSSETNYPAANCVYAGGLVGATLGNVEISNSYGASQVGGYYSGGLIGVTVAGGTFKYYGVVTGHEGKDVTVPNGTTTVKNSFAAGIISRQTRIGGGLIADVNGSNGTSTGLKVEGCYSACWWEALPPVAYGTFQGDDKNYYVVQNILSVPVGMTVEAVFSCEGDVFSLADSGHKGGQACFTVSDLENGLDFKSSEAIWTNQESTVRWANTENKLSSDDFTEFKDKTYPFPMPKDNDDFWGVWVRYYNETKTEESGTGAGATVTPTEFKATFVKFVVTYYWAIWNSRQIQLSGIEPIELTIEDGKLTFCNHEIIQDSGMYKDAESDGKHKYFWVDATNGTVMQGIDGVTKVTVEGKEVKLEGPKFYDPKFDPIKGYSFKPEGSDFHLGDTTLGWDFFGFYFLADFMNTEGSDVDYDGGQVRKYYIQFETEGVELPDGGEGVHIPEGTKALKQDNYIYVHKKDFTESVGYDEHTFSERTGAHLVWNSSHKCFEVLDKGEEIGENGERTKS